MTVLTLIDVTGHVLDLIRLGKICNSIPVGIPIAATSINYNFCPEMNRPSKIDGVGAWIQCGLALPSHLRRVLR
ncbi:hypothetical protein JB92DRAFT_3039976 [Gautieria morchelliformis]|nr:hypothetical protein JB92DRAFT_3039976 [Gautieria morchelliformis]